MFLENGECCLFLAENLRSGQIRKDHSAPAEAQKNPQKTTCNPFESALKASSKSMLASYKPEKSV